MSNLNKDPQNYAAMSVPHESSEDLNRETNAFFEAVGELRKLHGLLEVSVIVASPCMINGEVSNGITSGHFGNSAQTLTMALWHLTNERLKLEAMMDRVLEEEKRSHELAGQLGLFDAQENKPNVEPCNDGPSD
jgi:hypothetical protein